MQLNRPFDILIPLKHMLGTAKTMLMGNIGEFKHNGKAKVMNVF